MTMPHSAHQSDADQPDTTRTVAGSVDPAPTRPGVHYAAPGAKPHQTSWQAPVEHTAPARDYSSLSANHKPARSSRWLGRWAFIIALVALVGAAIIVPFVAGAVGAAIVDGQFNGPNRTFEWGQLSPVRGVVLLGEITAWTATALGLASIVLGIIAIAKRRGVGTGIAAIIVAALAPIAGAVIAFATFTIAAGVTAATAFG